MVKGILGSLSRKDSFDRGDIYRDFDPATVVELKAPKEATFVTARADLGYTIGYVRPDNIIQELSPFLGNGCEGGEERARPKTQYKGVMKVRRDIGMPDIFKTKEDVDSPYEHYYGHQITLKLVHSQSTKTNVAAVNAIQKLRKRDDIQVLDFYGKHLGNKVWEALIEFFAQDDNSKEAVRKVTRGIAKLLPEIPRKERIHGLKTVILDGNPKLQPLGAQLIKAIAADPIPTTLHLESCDLQDIGAIALGGCLSRNSTLAHISVANNNFTQLGCEALAAGLAQNSSVKFFSLGWNKVKAEGATYLARMLTLNKGLEELELMGCCIGDHGIIPIAMSMAENETLTTLDIKDNAVSAMAIDAFGQAIVSSDNKSLSQLRFTCADSRIEKRVKTIISRNKEWQNKTGLRAMYQQKLDLIYVEHRLDMEKNVLKDIAKNNREIGDTSRKVDHESANIQEEIATRRREVEEKLLFEEQTIETTLKLRETAETERGKLSRIFRAKIAELDDSLTAAEAQVKVAELECKKKQAQHDVLAEERAKRLANLEGKISKAREESADYVAQEEEIKAKIEAIRLRVEELSQQQEAEAGEAKPKDTKKDDPSKEDKLPKAPKRKLTTTNSAAR